MRIVWGNLGLGVVGVMLAGCDAAPLSHPSVVGGEIPDVAQADSRTLSTVGLVDFNRMVFCSGTLVAPQFVLTAAHCVANLSRRERFEVALGRDLTRRAGNTYLRGRAFKMHPDFLATEDNLTWDLALVKMDALPEGAPWKPAPLSFEGLKKGDRVAVAGYGMTQEGGDDQGLLRQAWTRVHALPGEDNAGPSEFVLRSDDGIDTCRYDSGGPVYLPLREGFVLVGVTSWGIGCGVEGHYSDLSRFRAWIESTMASL